MHSFLGLASYFPKFIDKFAIIAKPLYSLLRKDTIFVFGESEKKVFEILKEKLIKAPY